MQASQEKYDPLPRRTTWFILPVWLLLLTFVVLLFGAFYLIVWHPWQVRTRFVSQLESTGAMVEYEEVGPQWIRDLSGTHKFGFSGNPKGGGILDEVSEVRACPQGRPATLPREIPPHIIPRLTMFPHLRRLDLNYTNVTDDWLPTIARLKSLEILELGHARISGRGFGQLKNLPHLEELSLVYCPVRDQHLEHLIPLKSLKSVNLYYCSHLSPAAISQLQQARPDIHIHLENKMRQAVTDWQKRGETTNGTK